MNKDLVWVKAKCSDYYKLIKKVELIRVKVHEVKYINKIVYLKVGYSDLEKLNKFLVSYQFKIEQNTGLNHLMDIIKKEKIIAIALLIGLIFLFCFRNVIVKVNIIHENKEIRELLEEELYNHGIKVLRFKKSYKKLNEIRQEILDKYPDKLDWMEFDVKGMVVNVRVEERIITDTSKSDARCDLIATKDGVINNLVVYTGEAVVALNDYVRKGDTLVTGTIKYNEEDKRYTCAKGEVYATTWYEANISVPLKHISYEKTGKKRYNVIWENEGIKKEIFKSRFTKHEDDLKKVFHIFDFNLYIAKEMEVKKVIKEYSENEALEEGINKAIESINKKIGKNDKIIDKKVLQKKVNDSKMDIEVFVIVNEMISTEIIVENIEGIDSSVSKNNKSSTK